MHNYETLKLENQLCFPFYAVSRLITRSYQPHLEKLDLTYPQYLVLLVLWEHNSLTVNEISEKLILNTNTLTPLLKRLEKQEIITRKRSEIDERKVLIALTKKGEELREKACEIPLKMVQDMAGFSIEELIALKGQLHKLIEVLQKDE